jgi:hypothetical protein
MKKNLTENLIKTISSNFADFMSLVNKRSEEYFNVYTKYVGLGTFEEMESVEIFDERVLATIFYYTDKKELINVSVDFPSLYLWDINWEEKAHDHVKKYSIRRENIKNSNF